MQIVLGSCAQVLREELLPPPNPPRGESTHLAVNSCHCQFSPKEIVHKKTVDSVLCGFPGGTGQRKEMLLFNMSSLNTVNRMNEILFTSIVLGVVAEISETDISKPEHIKSKLSAYNINITKSERICFCSFSIQGPRKVARL